MLASNNGPILLPTTKRVISQMSLLKLKESKARTVTKSCTAAERLSKKPKPKIIRICITIHQKGPTTQSKSLMRSMMLPIRKKLLTA